MKRILRLPTKCYSLLMALGGLLLGIGCNTYSDVVCMRSALTVAYVRQSHNPERVFMQVYEKGSGFTKLLYGFTLVCDSNAAFHRDTIVYSITKDDYYSLSQPLDAYDWKLTDSVTGKVVLLTELTVQRNTAYLDKYETCYTNYKSWKANGVPDSIGRYYYGLLVYMNR